METYEDKLESAFYMNMDPVHRLGERFPWLDTVEQIASDQGFFHWELRFAAVFALGGFDLQVGNPPWVRPIWKEQRVLAEFEPWFELTEKAPMPVYNARRAELILRPEVRAFYIDELVDLTAMGSFFGNAATYDLLVGTQPDLYRGFMIRTWGNTNLHGTVGLLHPDTHFGGERENLLRGATYPRLRVHGDFVNAGQRFFPRPVGDTTHFGIHIYGRPKEVNFTHLSWLTDAIELTRSLSLAESSELPAVWDNESGAPGVRYKGEWDSRPHPGRVIKVDHETLALWQRLTGETDVEVGQAKLLTPVSSEEQDAIAVLANYPVRIGGLDPYLSSGFHEGNAKKDGIIKYELSRPGDWREIILKGIQIGLANPIFKSPVANSNDAYGLDLVSMPIDAVPETEYRRDVDVSRYEIVQDRWIDRKSSEPRRYTEYYRLAWRSQIAPNTERSLFAALIPPGPTHVSFVHSLAFPDARSTALAAGFWSALSLDYFLRVGGMGHLQTRSAKNLPFGSLDHPLASALLLRTMRLNCLTNAYCDLWAEVHDDSWRADSWACAWDGLAPLSDVGPTWDGDTPIRTSGLGGRLWWRSTHWLPCGWGWTWRRLSRFTGRRSRS